MRRVRTVPRLYCNNVDSLNLKTIPTAELFSKVGFINHPKAGLVNWLPMGLTMQKKVSDIIRQRMDSNGFEEVSLSLLQDEALWRKTGRFEKSEELFKIADETLVMVPTAEEEVTSLVKKSISTYKNLPVRYYQVNPKFRNEKRPRGGLLRGKEFMMKDAYSFDVDEKNAWESYRLATQAYTEIFEDLKIPFVKAEADSGDIGGSCSHEYHYTHQAGEDTVFVCNGCGEASNIEVPKKTKPIEGKTVSEFYESSGKTIQAIYPEGRKLEVQFLENASGLKNLKKTLEQPTGNFTKIYDSRVSNVPEGESVYPLVVTEDGDQCNSCSGTLKSTRAIEVGHTFFLGEKYSEPLECTVEVPDAKGLVHRKNVVMGCYGIGVSRILALIGEIQRDDLGFKWPRCIAPWDVTVIEAAKDPHPEVFEQLNGIDYRVDDRPKIGLGKKALHSNLVGIPLVVIVGKMYPKVEIEVRGNLYTETWRDVHKTAPFLWEVQGNKHTLDVSGLRVALTSLAADM